MGVRCELRSIGLKDFRKLPAIQLLADDRCFSDQDNHYIRFGSFQQKHICCCKHYMSLSQISVLRQLMQVYLSLQTTHQHLIMKIHKYLIAAHFPHQTIQNMTLNYRYFSLYQSLTILELYNHSLSRNLAIAL